jgi:hypothetical protein
MATDLIEVAERPPEEDQAWASNDPDGGGQVEVNDASE